MARFTDDIMRIVSVLTDWKCPVEIRLSHVRFETIDLLERSVGVNRKIAWAVSDEWAYSVTRLVR
jgi:hypothetical protein